MTALIDHGARERALTDHDSTLLVEAGAGTGKTALMAGRLVRLMADGRDPAEIAAITFTELAAGELQQRVARFLDALIEGDVPEQVRAAFPAPPDEAERRNLAAARNRLDRLACTTIHGFCKLLIGPYPVETGMDPGAKMIDPGEADLVFDELRERWLRERLSETQDQESPDDLLAQMLLRDPDHALSSIEEAAKALRRNRTAGPSGETLSTDDLEEFDAAVRAFEAAVAHASEPDCDAIAGQLVRLRDLFAAAIARGPDAAGLLDCAEPPRIPAMKADTTALRSWNKKGVFVKAAQARGASKAEAERLNDEARAAYERADAALDGFLRRAAAALGARFVEAASTIRTRYARYKRDAALMDFDDLLFAARDLLRDHSDVRDALAERFRVVMVDEFQDTDPLQADILWRLTETRPAKPAEAPWIERKPEPGRLFVVGDPKQAIYRFRGADVGAYLAARNALDGAAGERLSVRANFRSRAGLLDWVNQSFDGPLSEEGQPGFEALSAVRHDPEPGARVAALDFEVEASNPDKGPGADDLRRAEAAAVADLCRRLVGSYGIPDPNAAGGTRLCRPGDIALVAPVGTSLWIYESALESAGLPIATQAGKGAFRRQEILDLIALARVLADGRDTLALGALLRGPLVGLSEERLLDCVAALPRDPERPDMIPRLDLNADPQVLPDPAARRALDALRGLRARTRKTTPFELMAEAVEEMRVRPLLEMRHRRSAERALSNVDLFLELARPYAVRGIKAFAADMRRKWEDAANQTEGRPDAQQEAVQVITMHSAKGLEWPVVVPINASGTPQAESGPQLRRSDDTLHVHLAKDGPKSSGYEQALSDNEAEIAAERVRLWYVCCTRAEELLIFPRPQAELPARAWINLAGVDLAGLPTFDVDAHHATTPERAQPDLNDQDGATFEAEVLRVSEAHPRIARRSPSRHDGAEDPGDPVPVFPDGADVRPAAGPEPIGSTTRGLVLHKLLEEALTGETPETDFAARAEALLRQLDETPAADPALGPCPREMAETAGRALALPEVAELRPALSPEYPVAGAFWRDEGEEIVSGIADAAALDDAGAARTVVDWKSDVRADPARRSRYREQMRDYLSVTGAAEGLVVYLTEGVVERVAPG